MGRFRMFINNYVGTIFSDIGRNVYVGQMGGIPFNFMLDICGGLSRSSVSITTSY
jgi:hypothetical protein